MASSTAPHVILSSDPAYAQLLSLCGPALGGCLSVNDTRSLDLAATAGVQLRILRDSASDGLAPSDAANHLLDRDWTNIVALQLACESGASDSADWQFETIRALRARGWTRGIVGGAWATGNPSAFDRTTHADGSPHFPALLPFAPVFAATDYFALHGYVGCLPSDAAWPDAITWFGCRHRFYSHCLQQHGVPVPRWLYTESGLDRVQGRTAAGRDGVTAQQYAALVAALAAEDAKDDIPMRAYFTLGPTADWAAFGWADAVPAIAAEIVSQAKTPPQRAQDAVVWQGEVQVTPLDDLFKMQWKSRKTDVALNEDAAIYKAWLVRRRAEDYSVGVPTTDEFPYQGGAAQIFTGAIAVWSPGTGVSWV